VGLRTRAISYKRYAQGVWVLTESGEDLGKLTKRPEGFEFWPAAAESAGRHWWFASSNGMTFEDAIQEVYDLLREIDDGERAPFDEGGGAL
jgi:hypothetical protein